MKSKSILFYVLFAIFTNVTTAANAQAVNVQDSLALVDLYNSTDGPSWRDHTNWLTGPVKTWYGITVTSKRVTSINLYINGLTGNIPTTIGNLLYLSRLSLEYNHLNGSIPVSIGNLVHLDTLNLFYNETLTGNIPPSIGNLRNLTYLDLSVNSLSGAIPPEIGKLKQLQQLGLQSNQLTGNIPPELGNLKQLTSLNLAGNQLTGDIPSTFHNLINLREFELSGNQLNGNLPSFIGNYTNLYVLRLGVNQFSGKIPAALGNLTNLFTLDVHSNQLSGKIPSEIGNLSNLNSLFLYDNQIQGAIPSTIGNLTKLVVLDFHNNKLNGVIPAEIVKLGDLSTLLLNNNKLSGSIPDEIGNLKSCRGEFDISGNNLSGEIPASITLLPISHPNLKLNRFTFDGMELVAQSFTHASYGNQAQISVSLNGNTLSVSAGGALSNNIYRWYMDGQEGYTEIIGDSVFYPSQNGTYFVNVTNVIATKLTLKSKKVDYAISAVTNYKISSDNKIIKNDTGKNLIIAYPNPAKDILHIQTTGKATFTLTNQSGKVLITKTINNKGEINVAHLPAGLYYLKNNEIGAVQKVIITE